MAGEDELFEAEAAVLVDVGQAPDLSQDVLREPALEQQIASLKINCADERKKWLRSCIPEGSFLTDFLAYIKVCA
jgi:hypothetical protein